MTSLPKALIFDLDETLAETFAPPKLEMIGRVKELLHYVPVALSTAAGMPRIERDFLHHIAACPDAPQFYIFANSSAECFAFKDGEWHPVYQLMLSEDERAYIKSILVEVLKLTHVAEHVKHFGGQIVDRGAQVVFAALGLNVPGDLKKTWDPGGKKRKILADELNKRMPDYESRIGGSTTIDITRKGINKAYGVRWWSEHMQIPASEMLYVGDAFYEGGNDLVVLETGIQHIQTSGPDETETIIDQLLLRFKSYGQNS